MRVPGTSTSKTWWTSFFPGTWRGDVCVPCMYVPNLRVRLVSGRWLLSPPSLRSERDVIGPMELSGSKWEVACGDARGDGLRVFNQAAHVPAAARACLLPIVAAAWLHFVTHLLELSRGAFVFQRVYGWITKAFVHKAAAAYSGLVGG